MDFGLLDKNDHLISNLNSYRSPVGREGMEEFFSIHGQRKLFDLTGIANNEINTSFQLYRMAAIQEHVLSIAKKCCLYLTSSPCF